MARPKYQIFISSTFKDLHKEREAVTWAILSARHIPAGMENFTPTDDRGWKTILSVIDKSDYYVLLLAGNYGTVDVDGISWTEKEYDYAVRKGIPVLAFIRETANISADYFDTDSEIIKKKDAFHKKVREKHQVGKWKFQDDLVGKVTQALDNHIKDDEDEGRGRPGWFRGTEVPDQEVLAEFARLSKENAELKAQISQRVEIHYDGLSFDELKEQMEKETVSLRYPGNGSVSLWELFIQHASSIAQKHVWKESGTGENCIYLAKYRLINVPNTNEPYELTDKGFLLLSAIRKRSFK